MVPLYANTSAATHATTGALTGQDAATAGAAARTREHPSTGALTGPGSAVAGTADHQALHTTSGTLAGAGAIVAGSAARTHEHPTSGALAGAGSAVAGSAARLALHTTTGALAGYMAAGISRFVNFRATTPFNVTGDVSGDYPTTYWDADQVHPKDAAKTIMCDLMGRAIASLSAA